MTATAVQADPRLQIAADAIAGLIPRPTTGRVHVCVEEIVGGQPVLRDEWVGIPEAVASAVLAALDRAEDDRADRILAALAAYAHSNSLDHGGWLLRPALLVALLADRYELDAGRAADLGDHGPFDTRVMDASAETDRLLAIAEREQEAAEYGDTQTVGAL